MLQKGTAVVANTICGKHSSVRLASTCSASDLREPSQDGSRGSVSRKRHSLGLSRWQTHLEGEGISGRRGVGTDVDPPTRQPSCEAGVLALATDSERQLIVRHHDAGGSQVLIDNSHRGHLGR